MKHHPTIYVSRLGAWSKCSCGHWASKYFYTEICGAHLAFGLHLLNRPEPEWTVVWRDFNQRSK